MASYTLVSVSFYSFHASQTKKPWFNVDEVEWYVWFINFCIGPTDEKPNQDKNRSKSNKRKEGASKQPENHIPGNNFDQKITGPSKG